MTKWTRVGSVPFSSRPRRRRPHGPNPPASPRRQRDNPYHRHRRSGRDAGPRAAPLYRRHRHAGGRQPRWRADRRPDAPSPASDRSNRRRRSADPVREAVRPHRRRGPRRRRHRRAPQRPPPDRLLAPLRAGAATPPRSASPRASWAASISSTARNGTARRPPRTFRAGSGGIFIDMGVHEFDQIRWLTGQQITALRVRLPSTSASRRCRRRRKRPGLCDLSSGSTALVSLGRRFPLGDVCRVEVFGTATPRTAASSWPPDADAVFHAALRRQAEAFAARWHRRRHRRGRRRGTRGRRRSQPQR